jgi:DNA-binding MarR family transcriptional regulator
MLLQPLLSGADRGHATPVVVIGTAVGAQAARDAIEVVGGRLVSHLSWDDAATELGRCGACAVLMIEAEGASDDLLAAVLPDLDALAAARDIAVIVALDDRSIDVVDAAVVRARPQLLCRPTASDRIVALAIATEMHGTLLVHDVVREEEAARLRRLNEEVARIAEILARLTRGGGGERSAGLAVADHPTLFRPNDAADVTIDVGEVRRAIRARRLRDQHFGTGLFEDPAWDILLDLFAAELEGTQVSVSSLCIAASVAPTTALRWISKLVDSGLLVRRPDPFDRRRAFMELSPTAAQAMRNHVAALRRAGLPFG